MSEYDSNQVIANGYGLPYLFDSESESVVPEDVEASIRRIAVLNRLVVAWIADNRRIPTSNPNAPHDERAMAHWLRVCQFYAGIAVDHAGQHVDETASNENCHELCQFVIRHGRKPEDESQS